MKISLLAALAISWQLTGPAGAQNMPSECAACDWTYYAFQHERDFWVLGGCEIGMAQARRAPASAGHILDMAFLRQRYSGLPHVLFDAPLSASCTEITRPAVRWLWDVYVSWCTASLPAHCAALYRMMP